jgi:S-adenosylmethionine:tRNA ribosyltransferase-isomerase
LLIYEPGRAIQEAVFLELDRYLPEGSVLIYNDSQVVPARLRQGGREVLLTDPISGGWLLSSGQVWRGLYKPGRFWHREGQLIWETPTLRFTIRAQKGTEPFSFQLNWDPPEWSLLAALHEIGQVPLPPYITRNPDETDKHRYQTVYASVPGSVAAPTAGLHFTEAVLERLKKKGVQRCPITLHVGAGTFLPIRTTDPTQHEMHAEIFSVSRETLSMLRAQTGPLVCVGTTSLRTVESLYWMGAYGAQRRRLPSEVPPLLWQAVEAPVPLQEALHALGEGPIRAQTRLYILPGYPFQMAQGLITNFHQPQSTLIGLVQAFIGQTGIAQVYNYALEKGFRFLSYGDASLLWR